MWKRLGLTVVACGVMLGVAGAADAGPVAVRNTHRTSVQRTAVQPQKKIVRHRTQKTIMHRRHATVKNSVQTNVARRGFRGGYRFHRNMHRMV